MATATYTVLDANCTGAKGYTTSTAPANGGALTSEASLSTAEKNAITGSDDNRLSWSTSVPNQRPGIRVSLRVTQTVATITKITVAGEGFGDAIAQLFTVWVKNVNTPAWESIGTNTGGGDAVVTGDKTTNLANYFDADKDVEILLTAGIVPQPTVITVDDHYVTITYSGQTPRRRGAIIG